MNTKLTKITYCALAIAIGLMADSVLAQGDSAAARIERQLRQAEREFIFQTHKSMNLSERAVIDYGAMVDFSFFAIDDTTQETKILRKTDVQLYGMLNLDGAHQVFGRLRYEYFDWNSGDAPDDRGDRQSNPIGDRWWYRFDYRRAHEVSEGETTVNNLQLQVGRQFIHWTSGLVLSEQLYSGRFWLELGDADLHLEALVGGTPSSSVIDFDSSRPNYDRNTERLFYGGMIGYDGWQDHHVYLFFIAQDDENSDDEADIIFGGFPPVTYNTKYQYDSQYFGLGAKGEFFTPAWRYEAEVVYEMGESLSTPFTSDLIPVGPGNPNGVLEQSKDDIEAWAMRLKLLWLAGDTNMTQVEIEAVLASGDDDRFMDTSNTFGGNQVGTKDNAFNGFGYVNTGLAYGGPVSNLIMFKVGVSTFPMRNTKAFKKLRVGVDLFLLNKMDADAPIAEASTGDRYLGFETDLSVDWQVISDVTIRMRYGVFFPGTAIVEDDHPRHFFYTGVTYAF